MLGITKSSKPNFRPVHSEVFDDFVVFDLETTGLYPGYDEIIQIGAVRVTAGKIKNRFSTFVKPKNQISSFITNYTGISNIMVRQAPSIRKALPEFTDYCDGLPLVAHNGHLFDIPFLENALPSRKRKPHIYFDSMHLSWRVWGRQRGLGHALQRVAQRLEIKSSERQHDARNDASLLAKCVISMIDHLRSVDGKKIRLYSTDLPVL